MVLSMLGPWGSEPRDPKFATALPCIAGGRTPCIPKGTSETSVAKRWPSLPRARHGSGEASQPSCADIEKCYPPKLAHVNLKTDVAAKCRIHCSAGHHEPFWAQQAPMSQKLTIREESPARFTMQRNECQVVWQLVRASVDLRSDPQRTRPPASLQSSQRPGA